MVDVTEHNERMCDYGENIRIEQRFASVRHEEVKHPQTGKTMKHPSGRAITEAVPDTVEAAHPKTGKRMLHADGKPVMKLNEPKWVVYERVENEPWPGDDGEPKEGSFKHSFIGVETTHTHTWMPVAECDTKEQAVERAKSLAK